MEKYNIEELKKISDSLGIKFFESVMSHKKRDKQLPYEFYRNHYSVENCEVLEKLIKNGFALKRQVLHQNYYSITALGIQKYRAEFAELVNYKPIKERDLDYLKSRINFYCDFYNYRFCRDNSDHVISAYVKYHLNGYYMSHTTTDCVLRFERELDSFKSIFISKIAV
jgi:hypothetical protein